MSEAAMPGDSGSAPAASESIDLMLRTTYDGSRIEAAIKLYDRLAAKHAEVEKLLRKPMTFGVTGINDFTDRIREMDKAMRSANAASRTPAENLFSKLAKMDPAMADKLQRGAAGAGDVLSEYARRHRAAVREVSESQDELNRLEAISKKPIIFRRQVQAEFPNLKASTDEFQAQLQARTQKHEAELQAARQRVARAPGARDLAAERLGRVASIVGRQAPTRIVESKAGEIHAATTAQLNALEAAAKPVAGASADALTATAAASSKVEDGLAKAREEWSKQAPAATAAAAGVDKATAAEAELTAASKGKTAEVRAQIAALAALEKKTGQAAAGVKQLAKGEKELSHTTSEASASANDALLVTKKKDGKEVKSVRDIGGGTVEETLTDSKGNQVRVTTTRHLAEALTDLRHKEQQHTQAIKEAGPDTAKKIRLTKDHIEVLDLEAKRLARAGYTVTNSRELKAINDMIAARQTNLIGLNQEAKAAEILGKQQVSLAEAQRKTNDARMALADARTDPATKAAQWRQYAAELDRVSKLMREQGAAPGAVSKVEERAIAARTQARRIDTAAARAASEERAKQDQKAMDDADKLRNKLARQQQTGDNDRVRAQRQRDIAIEEAGSLRQADALERKAVALRAQANATRQIVGMEAEARKLNEDATASANRAAAIRAQHARDSAVQMDKERKAHAALARDLPAKATALGHERVTTRADGTRKTQQKFMMDLGGGMQDFFEVTKQYDAAGRLADASVTRLRKNVEASARSADWSARSFLKNTFVVMAWAASVGILYGSLALLSTGLNDAMQIERKTAILRTVFRGAADDAMILRDEVMKLAQAEGRSADEAVDAAVRFSRLGLTRIQVQQAVSASLRAANVAEISAAEGAENMASIMSAYGLQASQLTSVLNQLNSISNTYNVTNKDLLNGIARVGALAKQARLPLSDLMGMLAVGVGGSGRPGAEFGNAIKALIVSISTPSIQDKLRQGFNFDVKGMDDMKAMSAVLGELYEKFTTLNEAERLHLTQMLGQKQQASRLTLILEGYVAAQGLAIRALRDENSAERENANIRATMISQLASLKAAFDRAATSIFASRDSSFLTNTLQVASRGMESLLNIIANFPNVALIVVAVLAMVLVNMVRMASVCDMAGKNVSFLANSMRHMALVGREAKASVVEMARGFRDAVPGLRGMQAQLMFLERHLRTISPVLGGIARGARMMGGAFAFAGAAAVSVLRVMGGFAAVAVAFAAFDKIFGGRESAIDAETAALSRQSDELERATKASEAYGKTADLIKTVARTLPQRNPQQQSEDIATMAQAAEPLDVDRQKALKSELMALAEREEYTEFTLRSEALITEARKKSTDEAQKSQVILRMMIQAEQDLITRKQAAIEMANRENRDASKERQDLADAQKRLGQFSDQRNRNAQAIKDEVDEGPSVRWEKYSEERLRVRGDMLDRLSQDAPTLGPVNDLAREIDLLKAKRDLEAENIALIEQSTKARKDAADTAIKAAKAELDAVRDKSDKPVEKQRDDLENKLVLSRQRIEAIENLRESTRKYLDSVEPDPKSGMLFLSSMRTAAKFMVADTDASTGPATTEGGKRLKSIYEQMKSLGMDKPGRASTALAAARTEEQAASVELEAFKQKNSAYLDLLGSKQKLLSETRKQHSAQNDADYTELNASREKLALMDRLMDARRRSQQMELTGARLMEMRQQARRDAGNERTPFAVGFTDMEQMVAQAKAVANRIIPTHEARLDQANADDLPMDSLHEQLILTEQLSFLKAQMYELERRNAEVQKEKSNEMKRQTAEASKQFMMAGRAEQLQAIVAAKYLKSRGRERFTMDEWFFLEPKAKQNIQNMQPEAMPLEMNTPIASQNRELASFAGAIGGLRATVAALEKSLLPKLKPAEMEKRALAEGMKEDSDAALRTEQEQTTTALIALKNSATEAAKALDALRGKPAEGAEGPPGEAGFMGMEGGGDPLYLGHGDTRQGASLSLEDRTSAVINAQLAKWKEGGVSAEGHAIELPDDLAKEWMGRGSSPIVTEGKKFYGKHESDPQIKSLIASFSGLQSTIDPWCTAFTSAMSTAAGNKQDTTVARTYLKIGEKRDRPAFGDIATMWNNNPATGGRKGWGGHTAMVLGQTGAYDVGLSGNDNDKVQVSAFPQKRVLGYRHLDFKGGEASPKAERRALAVEFSDALTERKKTSPRKLPRETPALASETTLEAPAFGRAVFTVEAGRQTESTVPAGNEPKAPEVVVKPPAQRVARKPLEVPMDKVAMTPETRATPEFQRMQFDVGIAPAIRPELARGPEPEAAAVPEPERKRTLAVEIKAPPVKQGTPIAAAPTVNWNDGYKSPLARGPLVGATMVPERRGGNWNEGYRSPLDGGRITSPTLVPKARQQAAPEAREGKLSGEAWLRAHQYPAPPAPGRVAGNEKPVPVQPVNASRNVMRESSTGLDRLIGQQLASTQRTLTGLGATLIETAKARPPAATAEDRVKAPELEGFNRDVATAAVAAADFAGALNKAKDLMTDRTEAAAEQSPGSGSGAAPPQLFININGVNVQFAEQFREIAASVTAAAVEAKIRAVVDPQIQAVLAEVRRIIPQPMPSNVAPAG